MLGCTRYAFSKSVIQSLALAHVCSGAWLRFTLNQTKLCFFGKSKEQSQRRKFCIFPNRAPKLIKCLFAVQHKLQRVSVYESQKTFRGGPLYLHFSQTPPLTGRLRGVRKTVADEYLCVVWRYHKLWIDSNFHFGFGPVEISGPVELSGATNVQMSGRNTKIHNSTTIPKLVRFRAQMGSRVF